MPADRWGVAAACILSLVICWTLQRIARWFAVLNVDNTEKAAERLLEDPTSLQKVLAPSLFSEATKSLSVVVPAYNEADRIAPMLDETLGYLQKRRDRRGPHFTYEVIVVDDGSSDGTRKVVFGYIRRHGLDAVRLVQQPTNMGKGAAVKAGVLRARGELVLMADADGATVVSDVEQLEEALSRVASPPAKALGQQVGKRGLAVGSRAHLQEQVHDNCSRAPRSPLIASQAENRRHWLRNFLMHGFHMLVMVVVGGAIHDTQCGFKLMTRNAAQLLFSNMRLQRWCFDVELIFLAKEMHVPVTEVPVSWTEIPGSKIKPTSVLHMAWELLAILIGYKWTGFWTIANPGSEPGSTR